MSDQWVFMVEIPNLEIVSEAIGSDDRIHVDATASHVTHYLHSNRAVSNYTLANHLTIVKLNLLF